MYVVFTSFILFSTSIKLKACVQLDNVELLSTTLPGISGPPNLSTARGPVTLTAILFTQPAVLKRHSRCLLKNLDAKKLRRIFQVPFSAGVNL